jgi:hypothetical protein
MAQFLSLVQTPLFQSLPKQMTESLNSSSAALLIFQKQFLKQLL